MSDEETTNDSPKEETEKKSDTETESQTKTEETRRESQSPSRSRSSRRDGPPPTKLYIGNLPDNCKRSELTDLFEKYGKIEKCDILRNFAFVHFEKPEDAEKAVEKLDDSEFMGVHIQVQQAKSKGKPTAGENECFECGKEGHWARDCPRRRGSRRPPPRSSYHRGPDMYRSMDGYRGYRDQYRDGYNDYYSYGRYAAPSRYSPYGSSYGSSYGYSSYYGGSRARSRSPPRSYHSAYAYPPRRF